jgi:type III secretory pathway component EscS
MGLVERVKGILLAPQKEWPVIEAESTTPAALYTGYIIPLAAIPAIAGFIGMSLIGYSLLGASFRVPIGTGLAGAAVRFVATLAGVYVLALIIDALAPSFGGTKNSIQALKLAAFSSTASWIAGIFTMVPGLRILSIVGLYSLYLLFLGIPVMMKSPQDKSLGYTVVVIVVAIVLYAVIGAVGARMVGYGTWY